MNVNPVSTPGPASNAQVATKAERQPVATSAAGRGDVRQRTISPEAASGQVGAGDRQKAEQLRAFISDANVRLNTYHDEASGRSILEVRDQVTGDVVSQYPSEELIRLYASLRQSLVDQSA